MSLVRKHHGLTSKSGVPIPEALDRKGNTIKGGWRCEAAMNHLQAKRRRLSLEQIREENMPVILEVNGARNFVILCEKIGKESFMVQFPDARESVVTMARLGEVYDGRCILLSPQKGNQRSAFEFLCRGRAGVWCLSFLFPDVSRGHHGWEAHCGVDLHFRRTRCLDICRRWIHQSGGTDRCGGVGRLSFAPLDRRRQFLAASEVGVGRRR